MSLIVGGIGAIVALLAGMTAQLEPLTTLERAGICFMVGWVAGLAWEILARLGQPIDYDSVVSNVKSSDSHTERVG